MSLRCGAIKIGPRWEFALRYTVSRGIYPNLPRADVISSRFYAHWRNTSGRMAVCSPIFCPSKDNAPHANPGLKSSYCGGVKQTCLSNNNNAFLPLVESALGISALICVWKCFILGTSIAVFHITWLDQH